MSEQAHAVNTGHHWADWRHSGKSGDCEAVLMSEKALALVCEMSSAAANFSNSEPVCFKTSGLSQNDISALEEFFGKGDTKIKLLSAAELDITETLYPGIWLVKQDGDPGQVNFEIGPAPKSVLDTVLKLQTKATCPRLENVQAQNPMALATITDIIAELECWRSGGEPKGISLSHIPYPAEAQKEIMEWLAPMEVTFESAGSFSAEIALSRHYPAWYSCFKDKKDCVRNALIDFTRLPETMAASEVDIRDSGRRLSAAHETLTAKPETGEQA